MIYLQIKRITPVQNNPQSVKVIAEGIMSVDSAYSNFDVGDLVYLDTQAPELPTAPSVPTKRINTRDSLLNSDKT